MVGSDCVTLVNQLSATQGPHQFIIQPLFFKLAAHHLFAHFRDAAIEWHCHAGLNAPVVAPCVWVTDRIVAQIERRHVESGPIARQATSKLLTR